ncbi:MAG: Na+/H+ antiporter subunit C [Ardenticatenaceae bacterium]|nr:Na+/H+ antiporter subunit C [Ardenticatenaceae bacterium]
MNLLLAVVVGTLYGAGIFMVLRRSIVKLILGLGLLGHATNLLIFSTSEVVRDAPPLIKTGETSLEGVFASPLPQALVLTAIVIGLASTAFAIVLMKRAYAIMGTDDVDVMVTTEGS